MNILILIFLFVILMGIMVYLANSAIKKYTGGIDKLMPKRTRKQSGNLDKTLALFSAPEYAQFYKSAPTAITLADIPAREKYVAYDNILKINLHNGQLKLFLTELQFLTRVLPAREGATTFVVYAGSSPSHKMAYLSSLFPSVKFIFVDPHEHLVMYPGNSDQYSNEHLGDFLYFTTAAGNRFSLDRRRVNMYGLGIIPRGDDSISNVPETLSEVIGTTTHKFYVIEDFMTTPLAKVLAGLWNYGDVYFISDIRSKSAEDLWPIDRDIIWNCAMTYCWLDELRPREFMLKFRPPYDFDTPLVPLPYMLEAFEDCRARGLDMLADHAARQFAFIRPEVIWVQAFAPSGSSESRFVGALPSTGPMPTELVDVDEYEDKFYFYNRIQRPFGWHTSHEDCLDHTIGIDRCGDCAIMCEVFKDYYRKYYGGADPAKIKEDVVALLASIKRTLRPKFSFHGHFFKPYDAISGPDRLRVYFEKSAAHD